MRGKTAPVKITIPDKCSPDPMGYSIEGTLSRPIDLVRLKPFTHAIAWSMELDEENNILTADTVVFNGSGSILSRASVERDARIRLDEAFQLVARSEQCKGCGLCVKKCTSHALYIEGGKVEIRADECIFCKDCFVICPAALMGKSAD